MFKIQCRHVSTEKQKTQTKITFATRQPIDEIELLQIEKAPGFIVFSPDLIKKGVEEAVKNVKLAKIEGQQSPSKELRGVLYEYWYKHLQQKHTWEDYYSKQMRRFINNVKQAM